MNEQKQLLIYHVFLLELILLHLNPHLKHLPWKSMIENDDIILNLIPILPNRILKISIGEVIPNLFENVSLE